LRPARNADARLGCGDRQLVAPLLSSTALMRRFPRPLSSGRPSDSTSRIPRHRGRNRPGRRGSTAAVAVVHHLHAGRNDAANRLQRGRHPSRCRERSHDAPAASAAWDQLSVASVSTAASLEQPQRQQDIARCPERGARSRRCRLRSSPAHALDVVQVRPYFSSATRRGSPRCCRRSCTRSGSTGQGRNTAQVRDSLRNRGVAHAGLHLRVRPADRIFRMRLNLASDSSNALACGSAPPESPVPAPAAPPAPSVHGRRAGSAPPGLVFRQRDHHRQLPIQRQAVAFVRRVSSSRHRTQCSAGSCAGVRRRRAGVRHRPDRCPSSGMRSQASVSVMPRSTGAFM